MRISIGHQPGVGRQQTAACQLVCLVYFVYLVDLVLDTDRKDQINETDQTNHIG